MLRTKKSLLSFDFQSRQKGKKKGAAETIIWKARFSLARARLVRKGKGKKKFVILRS